MNEVNASRRMCNGVGSMWQFATKGEGNRTPSMRGPLVQEGAAYRSSNDIATDRESDQPLLRLLAMAGGTGHIEIARAVFNTVRTEFAHLNSRLLHNPIAQIDLELAFETQSELVFPVVATLQGDELCLSVGGSFFGEWFPCSDPGVVEQFGSCLRGVLSGSIRLVEYARSGQVVKARLEECSSGYWLPTATWCKLHWPSLSKPTVRVQRNRPSSLRSGHPLDRALLADLRDDAGDTQVFVDACAAIQREASKADLPWLKSLLQDSSALVREAVAAPIADLDGLPALRELLIAYQSGLDENYDYDGFAAVLIAMVVGDSSEAKRSLETLATDSDESVRENARWLIEHCDANAES